MENIDLTQTLPANVGTMVTAGGIFMLSMLIVLIIVVAKRWHGRFMPMLLGVLAYIVFVFVCTNLLTSALALIPNVDLAFEYNPVSYTLVYYIIAAAAFTLARILVAYMLTGRYERRGDVYMAGIGLGLGECVLYGVTTLSYSVFCLAINSEGLASVLADFTPEEALQTYQSISGLFTAPQILWLLLGVSAILDMFLQIALTNMMFGVAKGVFSKIWYGISALVYFVSAVSFQLYNETSGVSIAIAFAVKLVIFAGVMYYTFSVAGKEISYSED